MRRLGLFAILLCSGISLAWAGQVSLIFAGDIMLDDGPGRVIAQGGDPFGEVADYLAMADFRIGNLECPIATKGEPLANKIATFRAQPGVVASLKGRFDALSLANNHSGDYGPQALMETMGHLDAAGIRYFGGGHNLAAAHRPLWLEKHGVRIAVLAYNEYKPRSFEAGPDWPGVAWSEDSRVMADIRAAKKAGADVVIPFMHWGWEKERNPTRRQRELARRMIDAGAAAVIGGHPHVTQGAETYRGRPIIYSLGNFVFDGFDYPEAREGWLVRLAVDSQGVVSWETATVHMDDMGVPRLAERIGKLCSDRKNRQIRPCR